MKPTKLPLPLPSTANRIVQRQGAAPPWVEVQQGVLYYFDLSLTTLTSNVELETVVRSFRDVIRQSWTRRAIRMLTLSQPAGLLTNLTLENISLFRDAEWETRERAYHDTALAEVNSLVRKYNGMAPYAVRRGYYALDVEREKAYEESAEDILSGIAERAKAGAAGTSNRGAGWDDEREPAQVSGDASPLRIRDIIREWIKRFMGK